jgi:hypothetical protein
MGEGVINKGELFVPSPAVRERERVRAFPEEMNRA